MSYFKHFALAVFLFCSTNVFSQKTNQVKKSGNPIFPGWYADPEIHIFNNNYWVYPTYSDDYKDVPANRSELTDLQKATQKNTINKGYLRQTFLDAFSSKDLVHWQKFAGNPIIAGNRSSGIVVREDDGLRLYTMHEQVDAFYSRTATESRTAVTPYLHTRCPLKCRARTARPCRKRPWLRRRRSMSLGCSYSIAPRFKL